MSKPMTILALFLLTAGISYGQTTQTYEADSAHYRVISEVSQDHAQAVANRLESLLGLFNSYFHFDLSGLTEKLTARVFSDKDRYEHYLQQVIGENRENYVYLHYANAQKSELVAYYVPSQDLTPAAIHQSFIQYLRAFVANPPLWLREGFAVYFESSVYDPTFGTVVYKENLSWLDTLKSILAGKTPDLPIALSQLLNLDVESAKKNINVFYPQSWGTVWYLLNSPDKMQNRILWDSISALRPGATLEENDAAVQNAAFRWVKQDTLVQDFVSYVDSRRSFTGLVEAGMSDYSANKMDIAEQDFIKAVNLQDSSYVPYYYLGLINYSKHNYQLAAYYYNTALSKGATKPLSYYALGVNAFADNKLDQASNYLKMVADLDKGDLGSKADALLKRIQG